MNTLNKTLLVSLLIIIAIAGCSPAIDNLDTSTATNTPDLNPTNTQLPSPNPTVKQTAAATNTPDPSRDLSTPEMMLVGHWGKVKSSDGTIYENEDLIFEELNEDGEGQLHYRTDPGYYTSLTYQIKSVEGDTVKITINVRGLKNVIPVHLSEDGQFISFDDMAWQDPQTGWMLKAKYQYIDSQTDPLDE